MDYTIIFLLLFAVLAAAWFYLQRAKARPTHTDAAPAAETAPPAQDAPAADEPRREDG